MHIASYLNNARLCRLLLQHGADPDLKDATHGKTALEIAIRHRCNDVVVVFREFEKTRDVAAVSALLQDKLDE